MVVRCKIKVGSRKSARFVPPRTALLTSVSVTALFMVTPAAAQTAWTNGAADNNWFTAGNWSAGVPAAGSTANLTTSGIGPSNIGAAGAAATTVNIDNSNVLNVTGAGSTFAVSGTLQLGITGGASQLNVLNGGAATIGTLNVGNGATGTGAVDVSASTLNVGSAIIGVNSAGTLTVRGNGAVNVNGGAGTLFIGSTGNGTLNIGAPGETVQLIDAGINAAAINLGTAGSTINFRQSSGVAMTMPITGVGGVVVNFSAAAGVDLNAANTYTGTTTITAGQLTLNNGAAIVDTGAVVVNGGALAVFNNETIGSLAGTGGVVGTANPAGATLTIGGNNTSTTYSGAIFDGGGAGLLSLTKIGTGTQTLAGNNSYTGTTTITGGAISIGAANNIGTGAIALNGGNLITTGSFTLNNVINATAAGGGIDTGANTLTLNGTLGGTSSFTKSGTGTLVFGPALNTAGHSGGMTLAQGTLSLRSNLAAGFGTIVTTGSVIDYANGVDNAAPIQIASNTTQLQTATGVTATQSGAISEDAAGRPLEKIGAGRLILTGANTYSGTTTISGGTLQIGNGGTTGALGTGNVTNNAVLAFSRSNAITVGNVISGTGSVQQNGIGTTTLTGANTYSGGTTVNLGTLAATVNSTQSGISTGAVNIAGGATLQLNRTPPFGNTTITNTFSGGGTLGLVFSSGGASGNNTFIAGSRLSGFTGTVSLTAAAPTSDKLTGLSGTLNAALQINSGTTLYTQSNVTFSNGISVSGTGNTDNFGAIRTDFGATVGGNISLLGNTTFGGLNGGGGFSGAISSGVAGPVNLTLGAGGAPLTLSGAVSDGSGAVSLTTSANTTLASANTYSGGTTLNAGELRMGNIGAVGTGAVTFAGASTLGSNVTGTLGNSYTINGGVTATIGAASGQTLTLSGNPTFGAGSTLTSGNATLNGTVVFSPGFASFLGVRPSLVVGGGTFKTGSSGIASLFYNVGISSTTVNANATFDINGFATDLSNFTSNGTLANSGASATVTFSGAAANLGGTVDTGANTLTVAGLLGGTSSFTKTGAGTLTFSSGLTNTHTGGMTLQQGTLSLQGNLAAGFGTITTTGSVIDYANGVTSAAPINLNSNTTQLQVTTGTATQSGVISETAGPRPLEKIGAGTLILSGTNTYTGATTVTAGTLTNSGTLAGAVNNAATFNNNAGGTVSGLLTNTAGTASNAGQLNGGLTNTGGVTTNTGSIGAAVTVDGGVVNNNAGGTINSTVTINNGGTFNNNTGASVAGLVTNNVGGTLGLLGGAFNGGVSNFGTMTFAGTFAGTLTNTSTLDVTGGSLTGTPATSILTNSGTVNIGNGLTLAAGSINHNAGTITLNTGATLQATATLNNAAAINVATGGNVTSAGAINNNAGGIINFNGPAGTATLAAGGGQNVNNAGQINVLGGNVNVTSGNVINTAGQGGAINVTGGNMTITGDLTNSSTAATGVNVAAGRTLSAANISNTAGATLVNAGTLSATNPVANAGTLNTTGALNGGLANTGTVNAAGQVNGTVANNAGSFTVTGALTGNNSFTNSGTATLTVSGGDYSGITTLTNNSTSATAITVAAARTLSATAAINNTAGIITNNGTLVAPTVANSGTGTLANNATITGTVNNAATFNNNAGGIVSGLLTNTAGTTTNTGQLNGGANISGGTVQIGVGGTSGTITGDISNNGTLVFNRADAITVANNISGTGGVNFNGSGVTTLTGTSSYSGTTNVNAGTLRVNGAITGPVTVGANATLGGTGSMGGVTFVGGGTFDPGASIGTTTINGPLTLSAASTTRIEFSPTASDRIVVNGPATLAGSVRAIAQAGTFTNTLNHTFLTSTGRTGTFSGVTLDSSINPQLLQLALSYTATDAILNVTPVLSNALPAGTSTNAEAVANGISSGVVAFGGFGGLANLLNVPTAQLPGVLTALSGTIFTAVQEPSLRLGGQFGGSLLDQLGARRAAQQRIASAAERGPVLALASADPIHLAQLGMGFRGGANQPQWNVWGSGHGGQGGVYGDDVTGSSKLNYSAGGAAAGVDVLLGPDLIVGIAGSHGKTHFDLDTQPGSGRSDLTQLGFYASYRAGAVDLDGMIAYGEGSQRSTRTVAGAGPTEVLRGEGDLKQATARLKASLNYASGNWRISPYVGLQAASLHTEAIREVNLNGPTRLGLNVNSRTVEAFRSMLGVQFSGRMALGEMDMKPYVRAEWAHDFRTRRVADATFQTLPTAGFTVQGARPASDIFGVTAGMELAVSKGVALFASVDGAYSGRGNNYAVNAGVRVFW